MFTFSFTLLALVLRLRGGPLEHHGRKMPTFFTPNRHGYSVRFSPFFPERLVCATSQYYGLAGGGTLFVLDGTPDKRIVEIASYEWQDGLFDVAWSEVDPNLIVMASGDGTLHIWDVTTPQISSKILHEHKKEVYSLDWSSEHLILSASWDQAIKIWDPMRASSLATFHGHSQLVYNAMWSFHIPSCFASVSGDGSLRIWNAKQPEKPNHIVKAHEAEVLCCSWSKHDSNLLATGGSDGLIRGWDIRNLPHPVFELRGCEYAVRRIQFSPHSPTVIASVSYDFTTRIWDFKATDESMETLRHHSEFVYGLDFNRNVEGQLADCGWDSLVHVFTPRSLLSW